jgi:hypothetical protein
MKRADPAVAAVMAKLVKSQDKGQGTSPMTNKGLKAPDIGLLQKISSIAAANNQDAAAIFQMLPDTELAMQILVSVILSPKDMVKVDLNFTVEQTAFDGGVVGALLEKITEYFDNSYKITDILPKILQDVLFYTGSYPLVILPENSIDDAINSPARVTMESVSDQVGIDGRTVHLGILGQSRPGQKTGMESLWGAYNQTDSYEPKVNPHKGGFDPMLSITDNPSILKVPMLRSKMQQDRVADLLGARNMGIKVRQDAVSIESHKGQTRDKGSLYRHRRYKAVPVLAITPPSHLKKKTVGHPLVMKLPSECVIPVHMPSNPEEHLGYFVLLDEQGNPLMHQQESDYYTDLSTNINGNNEMVTQLLATTKRMEQGRQTNKENDIDELNRIYSDLIEEELLHRLHHGAYGDNVAVAKPQEAYRIMFARAAARMHTQALYIPRELMTYIAFDYNKYGVGTSLLQNSKIIGGMRAMLLFAHTMADIKNSVGRTRLNIQLDPNDPDPSSTVEFLMHEHAKTRQSSYPLGASSPIDLVSFLQNASIDVAVSGNTAYPETKMDVEDKTSNRAKPDQELENSLRDRHLMSMGLSPETVTAGAGAEFATTIIQNNLLLTKRVLIYQQLLVSFLSDFIQKYILNSGYLMDELREVMEENKEKLTNEQKDQVQRSSERPVARRAEDRQAEVSNDIFKHSDKLERRRPDQEEGSREADDGSIELGLEHLLLEFIAAIRVTLPAPDTSTLENQMKAYDQYVEALDKAIAAYIDASFMDASAMGEMAEYIEPTKAAIKAHYIRQWLRNNNVLAELDDLTTLGDDGSPAFNLMETNEAHLESLGASIESYITHLKAMTAKRNERLAKVDEKYGTTAPAGGAGDMGGGDGGMGGSGDDGLGGLDAGGGGGSDDFGSLDDATSGLDAGGDTGADTGESADLSLDDHMADAGATDTEASATGDTDTSTTTEESPTADLPADTTEDTADLSLDDHVAAADTDETKETTPAEPAEEPTPDADAELNLDDHVANIQTDEPAAPAEEPSAPAEEPAEGDNPDLSLDKHLEASAPAAKEEETPPADEDLNLDEHLQGKTKPKLAVPPPPKR